MTGKHIDPTAPLLSSSASRRLRSPGCEKKKQKKNARPGFSNANVTPDLRRGEDFKKVESGLSWHMGSRYINLNQVSVWLLQNKTSPHPPQQSSASVLPLKAHARPFNERGISCQRWVAKEEEKGGRGGGGGELVEAKRKAPLPSQIKKRSSAKYPPTSPSARFVCRVSN